MDSRFSRRDFLKIGSATCILTALGGCSKKQDISLTGKTKFKPPKGLEDKLVLVSGVNAESKIADAIAKLGGIEQFVKKGDVVVLKPNAAWARRPGEGATTNPSIVGAVVDICKKAGASQVLVVEHVIDRPAAMVFAITGIASAIDKKGVKVVVPNDESAYEEIEIKKGQILSSELVAKTVLNADVLINMPVAKDHCETRLSLGMKNLMGIIWDRQAWHQSKSVHQCIADFASAIRPTLTILDATTMLLSNGPKGPGEIRRENKIVLGTDPVLVDAFGSQLFGLEPSEIEHINIASSMGIGFLNTSDRQVIKV